MAPRRSGRLKPAPEACLTGTPDVSDANKKRVNIDCLPDVLLLHVLACVEPSQKHECREILPLVCKRWNLLLQAPSGLWEDLVLDFCYKSAPHQRLLRSAIQGWLKPRASSVRTLMLKNSSADSTHSFSRDGKSLTHMFAAVADSLQSLEVDNCNDIFTQVTFEDLPLLAQMRKLHLINFRQRISPTTFEHLSSLTNLQELRITTDTDYENALSTNCIISFPKALMKLTHLTSLSLSSRGLTDIPDDITALSRLQQLSLDGCCYLKHIPDSLHRVKSLQELSLNDTSANMLVDSLQNFSLAKLSMRKSGVHKLNEGLLDGCTLTHLDVSRNPFAGNAPAVIDQYQSISLEVLNLNSCELDTLPGGLYAFTTTLKVLDLGNNGMVDLPDSLSCLTLLECLNLEGNCFPKLPEVTQKLKSLCCLSLVSCNYLEIPDWDNISFFAKWPRLSTIWMWKTDCDYQDYSKAALQQLKTKLRRRRTRNSNVCYDKLEAPGSPLTMQGLTTSMTLIGL